MKANALAINGLTKKYQDFVLDDVSFSVPCGTIVGLIGENGAGKSTTINAILGLIKKDAGTISILGKQEEEIDNSIRNQIGVVFDGSNYPDVLSAKKLNNVFKKIYDTWDENSNPSNSPGWYKAFYKAGDRQFFVMGSGYIDINDNAGKHVWPGRQCMIWTSEMLPDNSKAFMIKWGTEEVTADGTLNKGLADNMRVHSDFTNLGAVVRCVKTDRTK